MKLNLTTILFVLAIGALSVLFVGQCSQKNVHKRAESRLLQEKGELEGYITSLELGIADKNTEIRKLSSQVESVKASREEIQVRYDLQKKELDNISADTLYAIYREHHILIGKKFLTDATLINQDLKTRVELQECKQIAVTYKTENDFLEQMIETYADVNKKQRKALTDCELTKNSPEAEVLEKETEIKVKSRKVWTNRGLTALGVIGIILLL